MLELSALIMGMHKMQQRKKSTSGNLPLVPASDYEQPQK